MGTYRYLFSYPDFIHRFTVTKASEFFKIANLFFELGKPQHFWRKIHFDLRWDFLARYRLPRTRQDR